MEELTLKKDLEQMQTELADLVEKTGSFVDPKVVELSQKIDLLVLTMQRNRMMRARNER